MRKLTKILFLFLLLSAICYPLNATYAAVPHLLNYQGRLTDSGGAPLNGTYALTFRIYDAETAGTMLWEETQSGVVIQKGIFSILLGSVTNLNLPFDKPYFLEIKVGNEVMSPRQAITSSGYAIRAEVVESAEKIKADSNDPVAGYLSEKVDNLTIKLNPNTHQLSTVHGSQVFTSSGTWTAPLGVSKVYLTMVGAGGGGAGGGMRSGGGGGGGGILVNYCYTVNPGANYQAIIGVGGNGGADQSDGKDGGNTIFDNAIIAPGGKGGKWANNGSNGGIGGGGLSGVRGLKNYALQGGNGEAGGNDVYGGMGGGTIVGIGASGGDGFGASANVNTGAGGGGAGRESAAAGGSGGSGICIIIW